jgi:hypothetical protein
MSINYLSLPPPEAEFPNASESSKVPDLPNVPESQYIVNKETLRNVALRLAGQQCLECKSSLSGIFRTTNPQGCTWEQKEACFSRSYSIDDMNFFKDSKK